MGAPIPPRDPALQRLVDRVQTARAVRAMLEIRGGGTKRFYGEPPQGEPLDTTELAGISSYEPSELVISARAGTPLADLEAALAERGQCLPFEPPRFDGGGADRPRGTVGGMVAAGLAGPARASVGGVRDYLLGATLLTGRAEVLTFGGQVMKNVAGYDVSRALAGSLGTLGVICEVSLKVLPAPPATATLRFERGEADALAQFAAWGAQPLPVTATAWYRGTMWVRLAGARAAVQAAAGRLGGERLAEDAARSLWDGLRDQHNDYFARAADALAAGAALWRLSVAPTAPPLGLPGEGLSEWGGGLRWLVTDAPATRLRDAAVQAGGHATLFRAEDKRAGVFAPLRAPLDRLHRQLKRAFDPEGLFNPGRMYPGL